MKGENVFSILWLLSIVAIFLIWPLSFLLHNSISEFGFYFFPTLLIGSSLFLFVKRKFYWTAPLLVIGVFNPALALFSVLATLANSLLIYKNKLGWILVVLSLIVFVFGFNKFKSESVFYFDHNDQQVALRNTYLYPDVYTARIFQNKFTIYTNRLKFNFFALVDPNNYFFNFHPREISVTNQNLEKFPFLAIFLFLIGIYFYQNNSNWKFILILSSAAILNLSLLKNFDKNDFILFLPIALAIVGGLSTLSQLFKRWNLILLIIFLIFSYVQILHLIASS